MAIGPAGAGAATAGVSTAGASAPLSPALVQAATSAKAGINNQLENLCIGSSRD